MSTIWCSGREGKGEGKERRGRRREKNRGKNKGRFRSRAARNWKTMLLQRLLQGREFCIEAPLLVISEGGKWEFEYTWFSSISQARLLFTVIFLFFPPFSPSLSSFSFFSLLFFIFHSLVEWRVVLCSRL